MFDVFLISLSENMANYNIVETHDYRLL